MPMNAAYLNAVRDHGQSLITHIGLVDDVGAELTGGSPAYARQAVTWVDDGDGISRPSGDLVFDVPGAASVAGWRGYSASSGGTDYGGAALTQEDYAGQGTYTLEADSTSIAHAAA
jgi:hypothetical protein